MSRSLTAGVLACGIALASMTGSAERAPQQTGSATPAVAALAAAADQQFTADGVTLRYRAAGTGAPIVLIHGYAGSLEAMLGVAKALPETHRMVALDLRGFGTSTKFADASRFGAQMVDDIVRLMDHLDIARAHLIGHSMGALISANVAARFPARVSSAMLVAGPFYADAATFTRESAHWTAELESGAGLTRFVEWLFPGMKPEMAAATSAGIMKGNDQGSLIAAMRSLPHLTIAGLPKSGDKTLLIAGTSDPLFPLSVAFAKQSPGSRLVEIAGADHVSVITRPEAVTAMTALLTR